ncbi:hypothetical protein [Nocardiopsis listeri]|uniref:hypothetical protein n=1 Tax=Nocardiopsis listeri TaxID=53440 RepID=UPI000832F7E7|nr:hypothetical protein [Nocardiopsis listeri]
MTMAPYNNAPETGTRNGRSADRGAGAGALVFGALFVGVIAACTLFIAYEGIYRLAAIVHADSALPLAHVFPVTFTLLVLMAFWVSYMLRAAPPRERLWIDIGLIPLLILSAAVPMVLTRTAWFAELGDTLPRGLTVVVAVAPLAALMVAFLLWIAVRAHVRRRNAQARPRPKPSDDRTTVLRGAPKPRTEPREDAPEALKTRLLRLGGEPEELEEPEKPEKLDRPEEPARTEPEIEAQASGSEAPTEPIPHVVEAGAGEAGEAEEEETGGAETEGAEEPREEDELSGSGLPEPGLPGLELSEPEPSVPTVRLPRRARTGDNPIKRAAAEAPVVPGAQAPEPEPTGIDDAKDTEDAEDFHPVTWEVSTGERDEGFVHEPDVGDPSSDESEAPPLPPPAPDSGEQDEPETEPWEEESDSTEPAQKLPGVRLFFPEHTDEASEPTEPEESEEFEEPEEPTVATANEPSDRGVPLWEPPADRSEASALDDYVPPVWTPPEEEESPEPEPLPSLDSVAQRTGSTADLALDHDTGPEVRAAFRWGSMPPGAARPEPEPEPEPLLESEPEVVEEPTAEEIDRAPEPTPRPRPGDPVRKRPMVLKPPRPPMPDFTSGPPSRRVRSEPLPPEDH